jgi:hypothetical protein
MLVQTARYPFALLTIVALALGGCIAEVGGVVEEDPTITGPGDPDEEGEGTYSTFAFAVGSTVKVCNTSSGLRHRSGPGTGYTILRVLKNGTQATVLARSGSWYKLELSSGKTGWSYGKYLCLVSSGLEEDDGTDTTDPDTFGLSRDGIINISKAYVGFSYWWGGAAFPNPWDNPQSKYKGKCYSGTKHSGSYGADCSGFVGKVWQIPSALPFPKNLHPYSTYNFYHNTTYWSHISRSSTKRADAMVYRESSSGHVVIYEKGDPWGSVWTYESRGCSYGVVHNLRTLSSSYRSRRRDNV